MNPLNNQRDEDAVLPYALDHIAQAFTRVDMKGVSTKVTDTPEFKEHKALCANNIG
jgi:hypothetical protein